MNCPGCKDCNCKKKKPLPKLVIPKKIIKKKGGK